MEETYYKVTLYGVTRGAGMLEAALGLDSALDSASKIEVEPSHQVNAWYIRASYYLWQGDGLKAEECKHHIELLQTQNSPTQWYEGSHLARWVVAYALADDLWGVKQTLAGIEKMAQRFESWAATKNYALGEYERIRGDYLTSLDTFQEALIQTTPGRHQNWADIAGATLRTLLALGKNEEASTMGREFLARAEDEKLGLGCNYLKMPLAIAEAKLGNFENAANLSQAVIEVYTELGTTGLNLGLAYETRARVAILMDDYESFSDYAKRCAEQYNTGLDAALAAKYKKLVQEARNIHQQIASDGECKTEQSHKRVTNTIFIDEKAGARECRKQVLETLIERSNTLGGYLYTMHKESPAFSAESGDIPPPSNYIESQVRELLSYEMDSINDITSYGEENQASSTSRKGWSGQQNDTYHPIVLGHYIKEGFAITGMVVLRPDPSKGFIIPTQTIVAASEALLHYGDVTLTLAA